MTLTKSNLFKIALANSASAGTALNSASVDMAGFDGCVFFGVFETANASNFANLAQSTDDTTFTDLLGTKVTPGDNNDAFLIDCWKPLERYVRCEIDRGGANTVVGEIYSIQYRANKSPVTHGSTIDSEIHFSPAEGTA